jgi:hypothetical protein
MRYLKYLALLAILAVPAVYAQAQVSIGVQIGPDYGYYNAPPVCEFGYYPYYPFACAPYGYWGPDYFVDGVFIGAGPWYRFYYVHPELYERWGFHRWRDRDDWRGREGFRGDGDRFRGDRGFHGDRDRGFRGGEAFRGGNGFRGGSNFHSDNRFRGGENFHGGSGFRGGQNFHGGNGGGREFYGGGNHGGDHGGHGGDHGGRR